MKRRNGRVKGWRVSLVAMIVAGFVLWAVNGLWDGAVAVAEDSMRLERNTA